MLRLGGELADVVLLNYLPASLVPWCVERIREGGNAEVHAYVHCAVTDRDRYADLARKDLLNYAVVDAYANQFERAGFVDEVARVPFALGCARSRRRGRRDLRRLGRRDSDHGRRRPRTESGTGVRRPRRRRADRLRAAMGRGSQRDRECDATRSCLIARARARSRTRTQLARVHRARAPSPARAAPRPDTGHGGRRRSNHPSRRPNPRDRLRRAASWR